MIKKIKITRWNKQHQPSIDELRKILMDEGLEPYVWSDSPGTFYDKHTHPYDEVRWMVKGRVKYSIGDREVILSPGDRLDLPAGTIHEAEVVGDEKLDLCFDMYNYF
jgi:quercetin dioxygenase-like cupin family protein